MKLKNDTKQILAFYFGDSQKETPEVRVLVEVGAEIDLDNYPGTSISIKTY